MNQVALVGNITDDPELRLAQGAPRRHHLHPRRLLGHPPGTQLRCPLGDVFRSASSSVTAMPSTSQASTTCSLPKG